MFSVATSANILTVHWTQVQCKCAKAGPLASDGLVHSLPGMTLKKGFKMEFIQLLRGTEMQLILLLVGLLKVFTCQTLMIMIPF